MIEVVAALVTLLAGLLGMGAWNNNLRKKIKAKDQEIQRQASVIREGRTKIESISKLGRNMADNTERQRVRSKYTRENVSRDPPDASGDV